MPIAIPFFQVAAVLSIDVMSSSTSTSDAEVAMLRQLLCRVKAAGQLHRIFGEASDELAEMFADFQEVAEDDHVLVVMTDASKRSPEPSAKGSQLPMPGMSR